MSSVGDVRGYIYVSGNSQMEISELSDHMAWEYIRKHHLAPGKLYRIQRVEVPRPKEEKSHGNSR